MREKRASERTPEMAAPLQAKYRDYETGALYLEKPEYMTQIEGDMLVVKNHPRIAFRGKLDSLNASVAAGVLMYAVLRAR